MVWLDEEGQLAVAGFLFAFGDFDSACFVDVVGFELGEDDLGAFDDVSRKPGDFGDVDAVALVGGAFDDFVEEDDVIAVLADGDVPIAGIGKRLGQLGQFVIVRREQCAAMDLIVQKFGDRPCQRDAIVSARATTDLVEDDEAAVAG